VSLEGKVAVVTGGGRGIGRQICLRLAREGAKIAIFDLEEDLSRKVVEEIESKGGEAFFIRVDVGELEQVNEAVKRVIDKFKRVDILINNAGITCDRLLLRMEEEDWDRKNHKHLLHCGTERKCGAGKLCCFQGRNYWSDQISS